MTATLSPKNSESAPGEMHPRRGDGLRQVGGQPDGEPGHAVPGLQPVILSFLDFSNNAVSGQNGEITFLNS